MLFGMAPLCSFAHPDGRVSFALKKQSVFEAFGKTLSYSNFWFRKFYKLVNFQCFKIGLFDRRPAESESDNMQK